MRMTDSTVLAKGRFYTHFTRQPRRSKILWLLFGLLLTPVFLCGLTLLVYLVFPPPRLNILVLGVDGRKGEGYDSRTDSIMVLGINPGQLRVSVLSIPRDLFIEAPGYGSQRINTINLLGEEKQKGSGPILLASAIDNTFGIHIDRYVRLDFDGFVGLVDAVGGITVDVERTIVDEAYPMEDGTTTTIRFDSGVQYMNGERALMYARTRHADDDYQRDARQQQVLSALLAKVVNPIHWTAAVNVLRQSVDTNLTLWDMMMVSPPIALNRGRFEQLVLDRDYIQGTAEGHAVPNLEKIMPWLEGRFR
jgi:LCP family protein required for cell wall assembly